MARYQGPLLVDTNIIIECYRVGAWRALSNGYPVETTEVCIEETQTGFQSRRQEQQIDPRELRASLKGVYSAEDLGRAGVAREVAEIALLDPGEKSLWAHILTRSDDWMLCGPDKASLHCGVRLGFREKIVSLERLLTDIGHQPKMPLRDAYTDKWLRVTLNKLVVDEEA